MSGGLVKTHDRLVIEDLNIRGMLSNHRLAQAISDAGWDDFARLLRYKAGWRSGQVATADRWYPSSKRCSACGVINPDLKLSDRVFICRCGHVADRDRNAAVNLAHWARTIIDPRTPKQGAGPPTPADGTALTDASRVGPKDAGTDVHTAHAA